MATVMIRCPSTGKAVPTGLSMGEAAFKTATLEGNSTQCAACGQMHVWSKAQAWVAKEEH